MFIELESILHWISLYMKHCIELHLKILIISTLLLNCWEKMLLALGTDYGNWVLILPYVCKPKKVYLLNGNFINTELPSVSSCSWGYQSDCQCSCQSSCPYGCHSGCQSSCSWSCHSGCWYGCQSSCPQFPITFALSGLSFMIEESILALKDKRDQVDSHQENPFWAS